MRMARSLVKVNVDPIWVDLNGNPQYVYMDEGAPNLTCYYWLAKVVTPGNNEVMMDGCRCSFKAIYAPYKLLRPRHQQVGKSYSTRERLTLSKGECLKALIFARA